MAMSTKLPRLFRLLGTLPCKDGSSVTRMELAGVLRGLRLVELLTAMIAIEMAFDKGWQRIWLECDSTSEVAPFSSVVSVPWRIWNRWKRCIDLRKSMNFVVSLIFREGNDSADKLAIYGLDNMGFIRCDFPPPFTSYETHMNRLGLV
ncbi:hypothetical protein JHK82_051034 [Glycine max]|nr:hypothetical protein JHK85_051735 [Glycine max]KAG5092256.1 hypothetical protein JHK82_051034 [Glycine max]KAG5095335.1 hypothetical protein JHK84_050923 [Glycine max]